MIHHPDKNKGNAYAVAYFHEIREAYETLTNPASKETYLQQRWYQQSLGKKFAALRALTPETVLNDCIQLKKYVQSLNAFRIDKPALALYINNLLNVDTIQVLKTFNDKTTRKQICILVLDALNPLDVKDIDRIIGKLIEISPDDINLNKTIIRKVEQKKSGERFRRYEVFIILLITALICVLIWFSEKK